MNTAQRLVFRQKRSTGQDCKIGYETAGQKSPSNLLFMLLFFHSFKLFTLLANYLWCLVAHICMNNWFHS
jgi:hypothetical protein